jgi:hypothetical protein
MPYNVVEFCNKGNRGGSLGFVMVELRGFEPLTSAVRLQRSPI